MLRHKSLVPLSHQHQHALALCVRIERASPIASADLDNWQAETEQHFEHEIKVHFSAEETVLFPRAREFSQLAPIVDELVADHAVLRESFSQAQMRHMSAQTLTAFARQLSAHIRREERQLFEELQRLMTPGQLADLQVKLETALKASSQVCSLAKNPHAAKP